MATAAELGENSRQGFEFQKPPCIGLETEISGNLRWGCGHVYDETPVGIAVYVRNDPVNLVDPDGRQWVLVFEGGYYIYKWIPDITDSVTVTATAPSVPLDPFSDPRSLINFGFSEYSVIAPTVDFLKQAAQAAQQAAAAARGLFVNHVLEAADGLSGYLAIKSTPFSSDCETFLASLGTNGNALKAAANNTVFVDGTGSNYLMADLYIGYGEAAYNAAMGKYGNMTVAQFFASKTTVKAEAEPLGYLIFINPDLWAGRGIANWYTYLHELVHNVTGLGDDQLPGGTSGFSDELKNHHCDM